MVVILIEKPAPGIVIDIGEKMWFRTPSWKSAIGITKAKRKVKKAVGIYKITKVINAPVNIKRKALSRVGYYSVPMKIIRLLSRLLKSGR